jgi:hypothetical protein
LIPREQPRYSRCPPALRVNLDNFFRSAAKILDCCSLDFLSGTHFFYFYLFVR